MTSNTAPLLTADDEPTARIPAAELAGTIRASRPSLGFVPHAEPVLPVVVRKPGWVQRIATWLSLGMSDQRWHDLRVLAAADAYFDAERVWDASGAVTDLHAWKHAQRELEHAVHARKVARGGR